MQQAMEGAYPDPQEQARVLFRWYGHGRGWWNVFTLYEEVPERLLSRIPVDVLVRALDGIELGPEELEGAAHHFGTIRFYARFGPVRNYLAHSSPITASC